VNNNLAAIHSATQTPAVANVTNKKAKAIIWKLSSHIRLIFFSPRKDADTSHARLKEPLDKSMTKRPRSPGYQN